jgi:hypothetical protein
VTYHCVHCTRPDRHSRCPDPLTSSSDDQDTKTPRPSDRLFYSISFPLSCNTVKY